MSLCSPTTKGAIFLLKAYMSQVKLNPESNETKMSDSVDNAHLQEKNKKSATKRAEHHEVCILSFLTNI